MEGVKREDLRAKVKSEEGERRRKGRWMCRGRE